MTEQQIDRDQLRALANAATPGPWAADVPAQAGPDDSLAVYPVADGGAVAYVQPLWADADFIAAARTALPQLLDQLDQVEAELDSWMTRAYEAEGKLWQAEERVRHLEDTARVLVKEVIAAEGARDEHRRGKASAVARAKAVEDVLDTWMTYCQTEQTARALSDIRRALEG